MSKSTLAIVGGGRWGQVLMSVIANMPSIFDRVIMVSKANAAEVCDTIASLKSISPVSFEVLPTLTDLLAQHNNVGAAIVVNSARDHFATARQLIARKIHVLIEKPVVLSTKEMQILIEDATNNNVCIVPGLNYRFCSYLKNFARELSMHGTPKKFQLQWTDATNEMRDGRVKKHDTSITVVQDVMPHIWTILSVVFQQANINILDCSMNDNKSAILNLSINDIEGQVQLQRNGATRQRRLSLELDSGLLALDFTNEPGIITIGSREISADSEWIKQPGPLTRQLEHFFSVISQGKSSHDDLQCCLDSVTYSELASSSSIRTEKKLSLAFNNF